MLGQYNLLPLVKGWQYKNHHWEKTLAPGQTSDPYRISEMGWLLEVSIVTTDAYGGLILEWQDADLQTNVVRSDIETARLLGALAQDPAGWLQRYFRPNPYSTAGFYSGLFFTGGFQGSPFPFVPTTTLRVYLESTSNQASAFISLGTVEIAITNKELFIRSLRQVLDSNADIEVPKELLSLGPVELVQQPNKTDVLLEQILTELKQRK
jgi:hypothetical protein